MLRNQDLNLLPVLDTLIREEHLSRAAERLSMSQPAVSNALKRLRLSYGDELFVRTGRGLKPTPRALELHAKLAPALAAIGETYETEEFDPATYKRTVDIVMNSATEVIAMPGVMEQIRKIAPSFVIRIHSEHMSDVATRLKDGRLTFAVDYTQMPQDEFDSAYLTQTNLIAICAPNHPVAGKAVTKCEFEDLRHVSQTPRHYAFAHKADTPLEHMMGRDMPNRNIMCFASNLLSVPGIVAQTDLVAVVASNLAQPYLEDGRLETFELPFKAPPLTFHLFWHNSRSNDPAHRWMVDRIIAASEEL